MEPSLGESGHGYHGSGLPRSPARRAEQPHRVTAIAHMPRVAYPALRVPYRETGGAWSWSRSLMARVRVGFHLLRGSPGGGCGGARVAESGDRI